MRYLKGDLVQIIPHGDKLQVGDIVKLDLTNSFNISYPMPLDLSDNKYYAIIAIEGGDLLKVNGSRVIFLKERFKLVTRHRLGKLFYG